jgi:hypothetical protein
MTARVLARRIGAPALVVAVVGAAATGFAADPARPADVTRPQPSAPPPPGGPLPIPYPSVPRPAPTAAPPVVRGYAPARVLAGAEVAVLGAHFGEAAAGRQVRVAGGGGSQGVAVVRWTPSEIRVRLPGDLRPGRYYVAVADAAGRWLSNLERTLEVADPQRRLPVRLDVTATCALDVVSPAPSVTLRLEAAGGGAPLTVALRAAGTRDGAQGTRIYGYEGVLEARAGPYRLAARDAPFTAARWDYVNGNARPRAGGGVHIERVNWEDCHARRRVTHWGAPLPRPERQTYGVRLRQERLDLTVALDAVRLEGEPASGGSLGSLPTPTPVCLDPPCP